MEHVHLTEVPQLERATLIGAFAGWNDAASAASWAVKFLINQWDAQQFAEIDPDDFYDFTQSRPTTRISGGSVRQKLAWPANRFYWSHVERDTPDGADKDIVLLLGDEPHLHWRTFTDAVMEVSRACNVQDMVLLGALVAEVPHTAPVQISGTASRGALLRRMAQFGIERATYSGDTGILSVLQEAGRKHEIASSSLWGVAPHYISATPNLPVSEALLRKVDQLYGFGLQLNDLGRAARRFTQRVSSLVAEDPDVSAYVHELERRGPTVDGSMAEADFTDSGIHAIPNDEELPPADQLIESAEEWLRQFRDGSGAD
jgi:hypothetical protein